MSESVGHGGAWHAARIRQPPSHETGEWPRASDVLNCMIFYSTWASGRSSACHEGPAMKKGKYLHMFIPL